MHVSSPSSFVAPGRPAGAFAVESLEHRTLLAWSPAAQLVGQESAAIHYPSITGQGQTVAVIDTGVDYTHPSLGGGFGKGFKVVGGYDFLENDADPMDTEGHGTAVAGVIAADRYVRNGVTYQGIAPNAKLVALRVGTEDNISDDRIEQALQWVVANYQTYGISVVNLSLGSGSYTSAYTSPQLSDEFQQLADLNISVFAASGNNGRSTFGGRGIAYPAADANVVAVGSVTSGDAIADYTQRGAELDLLATGDDVVSTALNGAYQVVSGTSFASPVAAGVAALVRQVAPWLKPNEVTNVLRTSGATNFDGDNESGNTSNREYSRINVRTAIRRAAQLTTDMLDQLPVGRTTMIDSAYDRDGVLHMAWYDARNGIVRVSTQLSNGKWSRPISASEPGTISGQSLSLAIDQAGKPTIAYYDVTHGDLRLATFESGAFATALIDSTGDVGQYVSLAVTTAGQTLVSYYDATNGDLKFAAGDRRVGFAVTTVDSTGDVGTWTSLDAVDLQGSTIVAVAYADQTNGDLKYSRYTLPDGSTGRSIGAWSTFVVDDLQGVANVALSLTGGRAAIAYRDTFRADVKYAYRNTDWFTETVADKGSLGHGVDLYYDADGLLHVAYYNRTRDATYDAARSASGLWSIQRIGTGGRAISVAKSNDGGAAQSARLILNRPQSTIRTLADDTART